MATWDTAYVNELPDSAFLYVESGGEKDEQGKTTPRSLRHFPVKDASGKVDMPHLRNALARIPQSNLPASVKAECTRKAEGMMEKANASAAGVVWLEAPLDLSAIAADPAKLATFSGLAYNGGPLRVKGYPLPVVVDLQGLYGAEPRKPILRDHAIENPVGHIERIVNDGRKMLIEGVFSNTKSPATDEVLTAARNGFSWGLSIGCQIDRLVEVPAGRTIEANGQTHAGPIYVARRAMLREISLVAVGADAGATVRIAASAGSLIEEIETMDFEKWLQDKGFLLAELKDGQKTFLKASYDADQKAAAEKTKPHDKPEKLKGAVADPPDLKASADLAAKNVFDAAAAAASRVAEVRKLFDGKHPDLEAKALSERWDNTKCELEILKAERPTGPAIHSSRRDGNPLVLEAAFSRSCGLSASQIEKHYKPEILEAADRLFRSGLPLGQLLLMAAADNGYSPGVGERLSDANLRPVLRAAFSSSALTTLLSTTGNKLLLDGFNAVPATWREVAEIRPVNDFKAVTAFRLTADLEYREVPPQGTIEHGTVDQESYTIQAKTYARMLALPRTDIINDDLGAFNQLRTRFGLGGAIKINKVFWTAWLAAANGAAFWTAARGNLVTSAALADAGIAKAVKAFRDLAGPDGNMLNLEPDRILVPSDLEATARKYYSSQEIRDTTASTRLPTSNIYQNRFRPIVVPELSNTGYTGYSATNWWLLASPGVLASAIVCFLGGRQEPTVESTDADFDTLGIQMRGYHDFGVSMSEYRASVEAQA